MSNDTRDGGHDGDSRASRRGVGADAEPTAAKRVVGPIVGCWAVLGLGMGLTPVALGLFTPDSGLGTWSTSLELVSGAGPLIGALVGLSLALAVPIDVLRGTGLSALANGIGYAIFVLVFVAIFMVTMGSRSAIPIGELVMRLLVVSVPVAITAGGVTGIGLAFGRPRSVEAH